MKVLDQEKNSTHKIKVSKSERQLVDLGVTFLKVKKISGLRKNGYEFQSLSDYRPLQINKTKFLIYKQYCGKKTTKAVQHVYKRVDGCLLSTFNDNVRV